MDGQENGIFIFHGSFLLIVIADRKLLVRPPQLGA
jgi:hypothetical protein